ncbi:HSPA12B [Branchiostoma lanceolatum]|uniref:HSPA12B protein n=1 Tax=Branchiostoma lanceolatum TaxID=7740 RepID=A0A8J9ZWA8_BRALA|nr:HSPA12B [Branchiostoma lanceolatum]
MDATERLLKIRSERLHQTEHGLRQSIEIRETEATRALKEKNDLTQKIKTLQNELATKDHRTGNDKKQTEAILQQKERELDSLRTALRKENQHLRTQVESLTAERDSLQTKVDSLKAERNSIRQQYTEVRAVAENFQYRLSNEFCIRLASDETNMENISAKHRPAKIAEKFAQIESKEWVEAKEVLDDKSDDEKTNIQILLFMLKFVCKRAQEVFDGFLSSEACRLYSPVATTRDSLLTEQNKNGEYSPKIPGSILKEITAFLKGTCGDCDIESLTQSVVDKMKEKHGEDIVPILQDAHVSSYVQACCRLAWQMAVQQPPLTVLTSNTHYDDRCHQLWYSSPPPCKSKDFGRDEIDFYIWPELRHSDKVLKKEGEFKAFGSEASKTYADLEEGDAAKHYYFHRFKMKLHTEKSLSKDTTIEDVNGKKLPALDVFAHALRYLKDHMLKATTLKNDDICWVLTVPAIWDDSAKQFMRQAAYKAGIASESKEGQLLIALEPEAAGIFCRRDPTMKQLVDINPGDRYMIVDCGGGTVDITVYEISENGKVKEVTTASGGDWGGTKVDEEFLKLLDKIFGADIMARN